MIYVTPISGDEHALEPFWAIEVATRPRPQTRGRTFRDKATGKIRTVSNGKHVARFKREIAAAIARRNNPPPPDRTVPIYMELEIGIPVKDKRKWGQFHTGRPDGDNIEKAVKDAIVDNGILEDDSQVVACDKVKTYCQYPGFIRIRLGHLSPLPD